MNDAQLLQSFAKQKSEAAFRTLVERHLPLVFGTARRMTGENALAEDIAQTVFILLSRKASRLGRNIVLSGWLYRTTRFVTSRVREDKKASKHPFAREELMANWEKRLGKKACKFVAKGQDQEKGPRCSWARNQMGNPGEER